MMTPEQTKLADAMAALLNLQLAPGCEGTWTRVFSLPDGGRLYFSSGRQRGQVNISASVAGSLREHRPYYRDDEAPKTNINVSDTKDAQRIAADDPGACQQTLPSSGCFRHQSGVAQRPAGRIRTIES